MCLELLGYRTFPNLTLLLGLEPLAEEKGIHISASLAS